MNSAEPFVMAIRPQNEKVLQTYFRMHKPQCLCGFRLSASSFWSDFGPTRRLPVSRFRQTSVRPQRGARVRLT